MISDFRVGFGFDVHQLSSGREMWLGGVKIDSELGIQGHSDADVLLHAICDAMLGALGLGDIGTHFPDSDQQYKGIDSKILLQNVYKLIQDHGYRVNNIDASLTLEKPKIKPYIPQMCETISVLLKTNVSNISIKATTNEKMGYVGRMEGCNAYAVVSLVK